MWGLVHGKHPGWRRARVGVASLVTSELFQGLGLATAGFGAPVGGEALQGHTAFGLPLPAGADLYPPAGANPAGLFHLSLPEWARYASLHLGLGPPDYLPPELLAQLHQPWAPDLGASYARAGTSMPAAGAPSSGTTAATASGRHGSS